MAHRFVLHLRAFFLFLVLFYVLTTASNSRVFIKGGSREILTGMNTQCNAAAEKSPQLYVNKFQARSVSYIFYAVACV